MKQRIFISSVQKEFGIRKGQPTHASILLFGFAPQRFLISSEIKCAHFHGTEVAKPIPFYQVYKATVFDLVDQAVDFVLSKINLIGSRRVDPYPKCRTKVKVILSSGT